MKQTEYKALCLSITDKLFMVTDTFSETASPSYLIKYRVNVFCQHWAFLWQYPKVQLKFCLSCVSFIPTMWLPFVCEGSVDYSLNDNINSCQNSTAFQANVKLSFCNTVVDISHIPLTGEKCKFWISLWLLSLIPTGFMQAWL